MTPFDPLECPEGNVAFAGIVRVDEQGVDEFWVELAGRPRMYGAWRDKWAANEIDFDIEIITFGYANKYHDGERSILTAEEHVKTRALLNRLFENVERRSGLLPFSMKGTRFFGNIYFLPGWIDSRSG